MILAPLAGMALVVSVATGPIDGIDPTTPRLTTREKSAAMQPLVQRATDCIVSHVASDPRHAPAAATPRSGNLGDLIVDSIPSCLEPVRAMIDAHDRYFGEGTGEAFFMGPYLDVLPNAVTKRMAPPAALGEAARDSGTARP